MRASALSDALAAASHAEAAFDALEADAARRSHALSEMQAMLEALNSGDIAAILPGAHDAPTVVDDDALDVEEDAVAFASKLYAYDCERGVADDLDIAPAVTQTPMPDVMETLAEVAIPVKPVKPTPPSMTPPSPRDAYDDAARAAAELDRVDAFEAEIEAQKRTLEELERAKAMEAVEHPPLVGELERED